MVQRLPLRGLAQSGAADGNVPVWDNTAKVWKPAGGGSSLTVQDENGNVATGVTQIDFQGPGVTATVGTGEVVVTIPGSTGGGSAANKFAYRTRTAGNLTVTNTAFAAVDTALDLTLPAAVNDVIQLTLGYRSTGTTYMLFDLASIVGGAIANRFSGGTSDGVPSWVNVASTTEITGMAPAFWKVAASDLSGGNITLRLYVRAGSGSRTVFANGLYPLAFSAENKGVSL